MTILAGWILMVFLPMSRTIVRILIQSRSDLKPALVGEGTPSIPKSWRDLKNPGGVIDLLRVYCFSQEQLVRMEVTPAQFLASGQRASGVHERPYEAGLHKPCFFSILHTIQFTDN